MTDKAKIREAILRKLPGVADEHVSNVAEAIAKFQGHGLQVDDVFPEGIVNPDGVIVGGNLSADKLSKLGEIIAAAGHIRGVQVFPRGIPTSPESFRVRLTMTR